jgi:hypothetical protein
MRVLGLLIVLGVAVSLAPSPVVGQEEASPASGARLADRLPADTLVYLRIPSLAAAWSGFQTLPLFQAWQDEEVQEFITASAEGFDEFLAESGADAKLLEHIISLPKTMPGEIALAILAPEEDTGWVLSLSSPGKPDAAKKFAAEAVYPLLASAAYGSPTVAQVAGRKVTSFYSPAFTIDLAVDGDVVLIAGGGAMAGCLTPISDRSMRLSGNIAFRQARAEVGGDGLSFFAYLASGIALDKVIEEEGKKTALALRITGLRGLRTVAAGLTMAGGRARETIWLDFPEGPKGLFGVFPGVAVDLEAARLSPLNTFALFAAAISPTDLYRVALELGAIDKHSPLGELGRLDKSLAKDIGLEALSDLAGFLGTEIVFFAALPAGGGPIPEVVAAVEVLKPDELQTSIEALVKTATGAPSKSLDYHGRQIRYVPVPKNSFLPITPCWCVTDGYLLASHHPTILKGLIRRLEGKSKTLLDDEAFVAATKGLAKDAVAAGYLNTERTFRWLYGLALPFITGFGNDLPFDPAALPSADAIARHLSFGLSAVTRGKDGIHIATDSDGYGPTSLGLYGGLIGTFLWSPWGDRDQAVKSWPCCGWNLSRIHSAVEMYRTANGRYPAKLEDLTDARNLGVWSIQCNEASRKRTEDAPEGRRTEQRAHWEDFGYLVTAKSIEPPASLPETAMLLWDSEPRHNGGRVILLAGGKLTWMREFDFQKALAEQGK